MGVSAACRKGEWMMPMGCKFIRVRSVWLREAAADLSDMAWRLGVCLLSRTGLRTPGDKDFLEVSFLKPYGPAAVPQELLDLAEIVAMVHVNCTFRSMETGHDLKAARAEIGQDQFATRLDDPLHFVENLKKMGDVMHGVHGDRCVKGPVGRRQMGGVLEHVLDFSFHACVTGIQAGVLLLFRRDIDRGHLFDVGRQSQHEPAFAGADLQHGTCQGQRLGQNELDTRGEVIAKALHEGVALDESLVVGERRRVGAHLVRSRFHN